jgi:microcystin-dependent protein
MTGTADFRLAVYNSATAPTGDPAALLWAETQAGIPVVAGHFTLMLGAGAPEMSLDSLQAALRDASRELYLEVAIKGAMDADFVILGGRQRLGSAPFAHGGAPGQDFAAAGRFRDRTGVVMPVGTILSYGGTTVPEGWLACNGGEVSRATYDELFAAIGLSWGTPSSGTVFKLPDLRGQFLRGVDDGSAGVDPSAPRAVGSAQDHQLASHSHLIFVYSASAGAVSANENFEGGNYPKGQFGVRGTDNTRPSGGAETRPSNRAVSFIIKY